MSSTVSQVALSVTCCDKTVWTSAVDQNNIVNIHYLTALRTLTLRIEPFKKSSQCLAHVHYYRVNLAHVRWRQWCHEWCKKQTFSWFLSASGQPMVKRFLEQFRPSQKFVLLLSYAIINLKFTVSHLCDTTNKKCSSHRLPYKITPRSYTRMWKTNPFGMQLRDLEIVDTGPKTKVIN